MNGRKGLIFDIQRFSIHDGSGIRTLVFMKGCRLQCLWCCNPESQLVTPEVMRFPSRCIGCGSCREACPHTAITSDPAGAFAIDRSRCQVCGRCVEACPTRARVMCGQWLSVGEVLDEVRRDEIVYRVSGGGVTISGGEPLLQAAFVADLLNACRRESFNTAVETCGYAPWENFALVLDQTDSLLFDIKHVDPVAHRRFTGVDVEPVLANLRQALRRGTQVVLRLPLVSGCNADISSVRAVASLARELGIAELHLLPFHRLGESKYPALGRIAPASNLRPPSMEELHDLKQAAEDGTGLTVRVGG